MLATFLDCQMKLSKLLIIKILKNIKNHIISLCAIALIIFTLSACGKDREQIKAAISETQVSYLVENALPLRSNGGDGGHCRGEQQLPVRCDQGLNGGAGK